MKAVIAILFLAAVACATPADTFKAWAGAHGKVYTVRESARRFAIFQDNLRRIEELNAEGHALFGLTQFADLTAEEFKATFLRAMPVNASKTMSIPATNALPEAFDWREKSDPVVVGTVKNQGSCGSCWAFSTNVYLEGQAALANKVHTELSEQQLVDCDHECQEGDATACDSGCNGGWMTTAMTYAIKEGMMKNADYKYSGVAGNCKYSDSKVFAKFEGKSIQLTEGDEAALQQAVYEKGPVAIAVHADPWQLYFGGIFDKTSCSSDPAKLDHGVAAVGWGHDSSSNKDYWIIRNSWGASWGEKGYIRVRMGFNMCGLANAATVIVK